MTYPANDVTPLCDCGLDESECTYPDCASDPEPDPFASIMSGPEMLRFDGREPVKVDEHGNESW